MQQLTTFINKYQYYLFVIILLAIFIFLDYQSILFLRPQGIHFIRQTDCLSFVANYYKNGFDFFHPQVYNLHCSNGRAVCEFPILYYITALLYLVFNEHEFILRLINIIITSIGFLYLYKLLKLLLKDIIYALIFCFLFISSTVLLFYINNFLPDASALGFILIGWYCFFIFIKTNSNKKYFLIGCIFFSLASLIKITFFINPITAILTLILNDIYNKKKLTLAISRNIYPIVIFLASLCLVLLWNLYVVYYNKINHVNSFLIRPMPIWEMSKIRILEVVDYVTRYWYTKYYYSSIFHVFIILFFAGFLFIKKSERILLILSSILTLGSLCYVLLFFAQFKDHDYYFITLIPTFIFLFIHSFITVKNKFPQLFKNSLIKVLLLILCVLSINYARKKLIQRYDDKNDKFANIGFILSDSKKYIDSLGISTDAKFIIYTDITNNGGLYFIDRPGWCVPDTSEASKKLIKQFIHEGANYILCTKKENNINCFNVFKVGEKNHIEIYKIQ